MTRLHCVALAPIHKALATPCGCVKLVLQHFHKPLWPNQIVEAAYSGTCNIPPVCLVLKRSCSGQISGQDFSCQQEYIIGNVGDMACVQSALPTPEPA